MLFTDDAIFTENSLQVCLELEKTSRQLNGMGRKMANGIQPQQVCNTLSDQKNVSNSQPPSQGHTSTARWPCYSVLRLSSVIAA